jgi:high-affinity nickel-transport protein
MFYAAATKFLMIFAFAVALLHLVAVTLLLVARPHWPMLLGFAGLAYALGVRHGFDADHIVAIDGTTRQLLAQRRSARGTGFYFSLGHSTIVLALAVWIAHATQTGARQLPLLRTFGSGVGLLASSVFMLLMAALNVLIFRDTLKATHNIADGAAPPAPVGVMTRLFARVLRLITRPPQMYGVGLLFGLGLDTASEIALLAIAAAAGAGNLPLGAVLVLPLSFAAGMSLVDTAEGMFMERAYGWAQHQPARRARYNLVVTGFTALAAASIGALECSNASWNGAPIDSTAIGVVIVGTFPLVWLGAAIVARMRERRTSRSDIVPALGEEPV